MFEIIEIIGTDPAAFDAAGPRPPDTEAGETFIVGVVGPSLRLTIPAVGNGLFHTYKSPLPLSRPRSHSFCLALCLLAVGNGLF